MSRSGPVLLGAAAALAVACSYTFEVPDTAQISCTGGGVPCPDGWDCDVGAGRCVVHGSVLEVPEVRVNPSAPIATMENGGATSLAVRLGATPASVVRVPVVSTRPSEATVFPPELTFTASDWNQPQTITVQGVRDQVVDGDQPYEVVLGPPASDDARFSSLPEIRIAGTNADLDTAQIFTVPTSITTSESDTAATPTPVQVYLSSRPSGVVVVPVGSTDESEATVSPAQLAFDAGNWSAPQTVRVIGVDDPFPIADGRRPYTVQLGPVTSSTDPHFLGATASVAGQNDDNDSPGVRITPSSGLQTYEPSSGAYFYVSLFTQPTADVTIHFTSLNTDQVTVDPSNDTLTFDAGTWDQPQYVSVTPVDDPYDEQPADAPWTIQSSRTVSADPNYSGLAASNVTGVNTDDEVPQLLFDTYVSAFENEGPKQVKVTLGSKPRSVITVVPASADTSRVTVSPLTLTLDGNNWQTGATMTVTPVDDQLREPDGYVDITFMVTASAPLLDPGYQNLSVPPYYAYVQDDERIIFALPAQNGMMADPFGGTFYTIDSTCQQQQGSQLLNYSLAMVAVDNPGFYLQRIASLTPNLGDGQRGWVLQAGKNYISETRSGAVIGRANGAGLLPFPLSRGLSTLGDYWTGLNADWTSAPDNCGQWTDTALNGRTGASGSTTATAISSAPVNCGVPQRVLCVEQ